MKAIIKYGDGKINMKLFIPIIATLTEKVKNIQTTFIIWDRLH